jgi:hypothetical protein
MRPMDIIIITDTSGGYFYFTNNIYIYCIITHQTVMLAFDPISCAVAFSAVEHICTKPHRAMQRARVWMRRAPSEVMLDVALNEISDHVLGALNSMDPKLVLVVSFIFFLRLSVQLARMSRFKH